MKYPRTLRVMLPLVTPVVTGVGAGCAGTGHRQADVVVASSVEPAARRPATYDGPAELPWQEATVGTVVPAGDAWPALLTDLPADPKATALPHPTADAGDKTGTNPLNFQRTLQVVNEYNAVGDASINYTRFRYTEPLAGGKMSLRLEAPVVYANAALPGNTSTSAVEGTGVSISDSGEASDFGLGDLNLKLTYIPFTTRAGGLATSLELDFPTASDRVLGTGKYIAAPSVTYAFFLPGNTIFAPAYKHSISFAGEGDREDVNSGSLDFYIVHRFDGGRQWVTLDPTYILNYELGKYSGATLRVVYGRVLGKVGDAVVSGYVKPGIGVGADRPNDWSAEIGLSLIGF